MVKKIVIISIVLVVLVIAYNLINQISAAFKSGERLTKEAEKLYQLEAKNKQLKQKLSEVESGNFIETQARDKLGLSKKGETVVIIPQHKINEVLEASSSAQSTKLPNWLGWLKVFFR